MVEGVGAVVVVLVVVVGVGVGVAVVLVMVVVESGFKGFCSRLQADLVSSRPPNRGSSDFDSIIIDTKK